MNEYFIRTEMLLGEEGMNHIQNAKVVLFGVGGVGSYVAEALARSSVGHFVLVDHDTICESNVNRQIHATPETVGELKVEAMKKRILAINPNTTVETYAYFATGEDIGTFIPQDTTYVVDAIDTVTTKIALIEYAYRHKIPVISSMGMANKLFPEKIELIDIYKTTVCPLAKIMRHELKKRRIKKLTVCYSPELPIKPLNLENAPEGKRILGSSAFVPSAAGLIIAGKIVRDIAFS